MIRILALILYFILVCPELGRTQTNDAPVADAFFSICEPALDAKVKQLWDRYYFVSDDTSCESLQQSVDWFINYAKSERDNDRLKSR
jgi:hypothetical protein